MAITCNRAAQLEDAMFADDDPEAGYVDGEFRMTRLQEECAEKWNERDGKPGTNARQVAMFFVVE